MRNKTTAAFLAFFLGGIGIHQFYLGKNLTGIIYLLFCWTFIPALIAFIEFIIFLTMSDADFDKKYNENTVALAPSINVTVESPVKEKAPVPATAVSSKTKYENLERIGNLLEKGIITKEEFEIEKKSILSASPPPDNKSESSQEKTIDPVEISLCEKINTEIRRTKGSLLGGVNDKLVELLNEACVDQEHATNLLDNYQRLYKNDLVKNISDLSSSYDIIKTHLTPLIDKRLVEAKYPHNRIK